MSLGKKDRGRALRRDSRMPFLSISDGRKAIASSLERAWGLPRYSRIIHRLGSVDVSADAEYQRDFNGYFRVRRSSEWQRVFYAELERLKAMGAEFEPVLNYLYERTGHVEASFASKLVAVVDPTKPILDSKVLAYLGLRIGGPSPEYRLAAAVRAYGQIVEWYKAYLGSSEAAANIELFDSLLPDYEWVSDTKKIDFLIWGSSPS